MVRCLDAWNIAAVPLDRRIALIADVGEGRLGQGEVMS
jgi:hypothetical protein